MKSLKSRENIFLSILVLCFLILFSGCEKGSGLFPKEKEENFESPEEFLENPSVKNALEEAGTPIFQGDNPPVLTGTYHVEGSVMDASYVINSLVGTVISSTFVLYNQTASGKISFREEISGIAVKGSGGYIIGDNGQFTIFQESVQKGEEAGLPSDLSITVVLIMSGRKQENGDLHAEGTSIITKATSSNSDKYDLEGFKQVWWMWRCFFILQGPAKKSELKDANKPLLRIPQLQSQEIEFFRIE